MGAEVVDYEEGEEDEEKGEEEGGEGWGVEGVEVDDEEACESHEECQVRDRCFSGGEVE